MTLPFNPNAPAPGAPVVVVQFDDELNLYIEIVAIWLREDGNEHARVALPNWNMSEWRDERVFIGDVVSRQGVRGWYRAALAGELEVSRVAHRQPHLRGAA